MKTILVIPNLGLIFGLFSFISACWFLLVFGSFAIDCSFHHTAKLADYQLLHAHLNRIPSIRIFTYLLTYFLLKRFTDLRFLDPEFSHIHIKPVLSSSLLLRLAFVTTALYKYKLM